MKGTKLGWLNLFAVAAVLTVIATPAAWSRHVNPPGAVGGRGHGPYWHRNPAGPCGGPGRGWNHNPPGPGRVSYRAPGPVNPPGQVNPPGPSGGVGHGPYWHRNPAGPTGGPGRGWTHNPPGPGRTYFPS